MTESSDLSPEIRQALEQQAEALAHSLWDFIAGECFGMTPDPWVCWDESSGDGCDDPRKHNCQKSTLRLAKHLLTALVTAYQQGAAGRQGEVGDEAEAAPAGLRERLLSQAEYMETGGPFGAVPRVVETDSDVWRTAIALLLEAAAALQEREP